jgi:uncharacterized 2Fe-2S/4Fe-4S cluster protein (DUF4445 family)
LTKQSVRVRFEPDSVEVWVVSGSTIKEALFAASIPISMPCGGHGRCGKCVVQVEGRVSEPDEEELERLPKRMKNARLACMARLEGSAEVTLPATSRIAIQKIVTTGRVSHSFKFDPGIKKVFLGKRIGKRKGKDAWESLRASGIGMEDVAINMADSRLMDEALGADHGWRLGLHAEATAVVTDSEIVAFEAGDTSTECYGIAVDVGTNTIICSLVDLTTGREFGTTASINPQVAHGDDVVSRIRFAKTPGGLDLLQREIVHLINGMTNELLKTFGVSDNRVYMCSAVGNTAMQHILVGVSPVDLGRAPYRAVLTGPVDTLASTSGLGGHRDCRLIMPPPIGGFVGGDLVALMLSRRFLRKKAAVMAIDLGTNGEIALSANGRLAACSTAAGPAFEGERISSGVRAVAGAIEDLRITRDGIKTKTIGNSPALGLCGSGLIAAVSELLRVGVLEPSGRLKTRGEITNKILAGRVVTGERGREFVIRRRPSIRLRQGDIREVQLGKAALCAGMRVLAAAAGTRLEDVATVLIAGSFGSSLRPSCLRRLGLLPPEIRGRIRIIGNSAIEGAKILLTSRSARREATKLAERTQHVELFSRPEFKDEFYAGMAFPGSELSG